MLRKGLRTLPWVDELVAFLVSDRLLRIRDMEYYATQRLERRLAMTPRMAIHEVQTTRATRQFRAGTFSTTYPTGFYPGIWHLGVQLARLVDWQSICNLVHIKEWESWLQSLPPTAQTEVRNLLGVT